MKNSQAVVSGLVSMAVVAVVSGYGLLSLRRAADAVAPPAPPEQRAEPEEIRAHPGYAPGDPLDRNAPVITPLFASDPSSMVVAPTEEPEEILNLVNAGEQDVPAPRRFSDTPRVLTSSGAIVTPLNVRDAAALVMGPGRRDPSAPTAAPRKAKAARPSSDLPPEIRSRFR